MLANYEIPIGHYEVATGEQEEVLTVQQASSPGRRSSGGSNWQSTPQRS